MAEKIKRLCKYFMFLALILVVGLGSPTEVKADDNAIGMGDIKLSKLTFDKKGAVTKVETKDEVTGSVDESELYIAWQSIASNSSGAGIKLYDKYWTITVKNNDTGKTKKVAFYPDDEDQDGDGKAEYKGKEYSNRYYSYTKVDDDSRTDKDGNYIIKIKYYKTYYIPIADFLDIIKKETKWDLLEGDYTVKANATMGFRYKDKNGKVDTKLSKLYNETDYTTPNSFYQACSNYGMGEVEDLKKRHKGFFDKYIPFDFLKVTVKTVGGGFKSTKGQGWYSAGSTVDVFATPKDEGYNYKKATSSNAQDGDIAKKNKYTIANLTKNTTITFTSEPWEHTVTYNLAGGSTNADEEIEKGFTKKYGTDKTLTSTIPFKAGYTFNGWKHSKNKEIYAVGAKYDYDKNGVKVKLTAQWEESLVTLRFHGIEGDEEVTGSIGDITTQYTKSFTMPKNAFSRSNKNYEFDNWKINIGDGIIVKPGDKISAAELQKKLTVSGTPELNNTTGYTRVHYYIDVYAVWKEDNPPSINAINRYFRLSEAQAGVITENELLKKVTANDKEDEEKGKKVTPVLKDLDIAKYKNLKAEDIKLVSFGEKQSGTNSSASITFQIYEKVFTETVTATDSTGKTTTTTFEVHIMNDIESPNDSETPEPDPDEDPDEAPEPGDIIDPTPNEDPDGYMYSKYNYVRFISLKYLDNAPNDGGLMKGSVWREQENKEYLRKVLSLKRINPELTPPITFLPGLVYQKEIPGSGEWNGEIEQEWYFTKDDIDNVKAFVDDHGLGNSKESNGLQLFLEKFKDNRTK